MSIKIFTDAASNLFNYILKEKELDINVLPMTLQIGEESHLCYEENIDVEKFSKTLYEKLSKGEKAKTSLTSPGQFEKAFTDEVEKGNQVIFVCIASGISGNYQSSSLIASQINEEYGKELVKVIDAKTASFGEGMVAMYAYKLAKEGKTFEEVASLTEEYVKRVRSEFTVDNIKYLSNSGRVSSIVATIASILSIKPLLYGSDKAKIEVSSKVHGRNNAINTLAQQVVDYIADKNSKVFIAHCNSLDDANKLANLLRNNGINDIEIYYYDIVTGAHVGPGTLAVFYEGHNRTIEKKSLIKSIIGK